MEYRCVKVGSHDNIGLVEMDRKHELNALSLGMIEELNHVFKVFITEADDVRLVVFTGGDTCFSAGMDIKEMPTLSDADLARYFNLTVDLYTLLMAYPKILITAVSGIAFGGGFNLSMMGDIIIASEGAIFGHPEIKYGFNPLLAPLVARIGVAKTKELTLTGEPIGAKEAYSIGLVNRVVPPESFKEITQEWARKLSGMEPEAVRGLKRAFDVVTRLDSRAAIEYELEMTALFLSKGETKEHIREKFPEKHE